MMENIKDIARIGWWLGWRTALFLGGIVGVMLLVSLVDEVIR